MDPPCRTCPMKTFCPISKTCEWLSRPNIAILEMAQTIKENWHLIHKMRGKVLTRNFVDNLEQVIVPLMDQY